MTTQPGAPEGVGCKSLVAVAGALMAFAVVMVTIGLVILLGDPSATSEAIGFTAYAAGAPVSGAFAALAGGLPLTLYLDALVWILIGAGIVRLSERGRSLQRLVLTTVSVAIVYGVIISSLVELA